MAFNITVVAFGKTPDISDEKILEYRGFDPALVGKDTEGEITTYRFNSEVPDAHISHIRVLDINVSSPNLVVIFELPLKDPSLTDEQNQVVLSDLIKDVMQEMIPRIGGVEQHQIDGPWDGGSVIAVTFLDVADNLNKILSAAQSNAIREINKH